MIGLSSLFLSSPPPPMSSPDVTKSAHEDETEPHRHVATQAGILKVVSAQRVWSVSSHLFLRTANHSSQLYCRGPKSKMCVLFPRSSDVAEPSLIEPFTADPAVSGSASLSLRTYHFLVPKALTHARAPQLRLLP